MIYVHVMSETSLVRRATQLDNSLTRELRRYSMSRELEAIMRLES
jgi:hypothetical protein